MTAAELESYFDILTDKVGSSYFLQSEKSTFLSQAQVKYITDLLPVSQEGILNVEMSSPVVNNIHTLIYETGNINPVTGEIAKSAVQSALDTVSGSTEPYMYVMGISFNGYPCRFTRHNDWYELQRNSFKAGSATAPRYRQMANKFLFAPNSSAAQVKFTLLKYPKDVNLGSSITSELPSQTHKTIVELAVQLAAVSMRDQDLKPN